MKDSHFLTGFEYWKELIVCVLWGQRAMYVLFDNERASKHTGSNHCSIHYFLFCGADSLRAREVYGSFNLNRVVLHIIVSLTVSWQLALLR